MVMEMNGKKFIEEIRQSIEADRDRRIWEDAVRAVSLVSELIFTRSSHFVMEIIQNAEDAGIGLSENGEMEIRFSRKRVFITHDVRPFSKDNVNALCGIRTTKKPELGTIGYLGIGFKSVFKITDSPHIFSGDFQFKFDKNEWENPNEVPWQIMPFPIENLPEPIDPNLTTFYFPFRNEKAYEETKNELKNLSLHLYLFLKWIKKITIVDEESGETTTLENLGEENRIVDLTRNDEKERYLMLRRLCEVPSHVADDEVTKSAKRSNVKQREITVAFKIDEENNLVPSTADKAYGGVYSFLPLEEERSGTKFLIQADFIGVPGRESINYEAPWNHWLIEQVTEAVKEAIELFKQNTLWREQYLSLFEFTSHQGQPSFKKLFRPKLHDPLKKHLKNMIPTYDGFSDLENAVTVSENIHDLLSNNDLKTIFPKKAKPAMVKSKTKLGPFKFKISKLDDVFSIAKNKDLLQEKAKKAQAVEWFYKLYLEIYKLVKGSDPYHAKGKYLRSMYLLTENLDIKRNDEVYFKSFPQEVLELSKKYPDVAKVLSSVSFLHPKLEKNLSGFFGTYLEVKRLDYSKICEEEFLPKIRTKVTPPSKEELITYIRLFRKSHVYISGDIWVLTKNNNIKPSNEVFFSAEYSPVQNWEKNKRYLSGVEFLSTKYIIDSKDIEDINKWKRFFAETGVKERGSNAHVEDFGVNFTLEKLGSKSAEGILGYYFVKFDDVHKQHDRGYDFVGTTMNGGEKYLEVKSRTIAGDIELTRNETEKAEMYKDDYLLCIADGIPENPELYILPDPVKHGRKEGVAVPENGWRGFKLQV